MYQNIQKLVGQLFLLNYYILKSALCVDFVACENPIFEQKSNDLNNG
jgi:hypothetical protein